MLAPAQQPAPKDKHMTHKLYRDKDEPGYEDVELELDDDIIQYLENRAREEQKTVDEVIEDVLRLAIKEMEEDDEEVSDT